MLFIFKKQLSANMLLSDSFQLFVTSWQTGVSVSCSAANTYCTASFRLDWFFIYIDKKIMCRERCILRYFTNTLLPTASPRAHFMVERVIAETSEEDEEWIPNQKERSEETYKGEDGGGGSLFPSMDIYWKLHISNVVYFLYAIFLWIFLELSATSHGLHQQMEFTQLSWRWFSCYHITFLVKLLSLYM